MKRDAIPYFSLVSLVGTPSMPIPARAILARSLARVRSYSSARACSAARRLRVTSSSSSSESTVSLCFSSCARLAANLAASIYDIALSEGIEPSLAYRLVHVESGFTRRAISHKGAVGLTQLMPRTAMGMRPELTYRDLFNTETNLRLGFRYLTLMLNRYDGDMRLALLAYNRGPGTVDGVLSRGGDPANGYARAVMNGQ